MEKVKGYLIALLIGIIIGCSICFFINQRASLERVGEYRAVQSTIIEDNIRIRGELFRVEQELSRYKDFNLEARRILSNQGSSISKLKAILENLPDN